VPTTAPAVAAIAIPARRATRRRHRALQGAASGRPLVRLPRTRPRSRSASRRRVNDRAVHKLSDFLTRRQLRRLELYEAIRPTASIPQAPAPPRTCRVRATGSQRPGVLAEADRASRRRLGGQLTTQHATRVELFTERTAGNLSHVATTPRLMPVREADSPEGRKWTRLTFALWLAVFYLVLLYVGLR
jgi:hypothetical protein